MSERTEVERAADQLVRAYRGPAWSGPSVAQALRGVDAATAATRPPGGAHSIWEIAAHIGAWEETVRRRLEGEPYSPRGAANFPRPRAASAAEWRATLERLGAIHDALVARVRTLTDESLARSPYAGAAGAYVLIHGAAQHDLYHAGQIVLLRKLLRAGRRTGAPRSPKRGARGAPERRVRRRSK